MLLVRREEVAAPRLRAIMCTSPVPPIPLNLHVVPGPGPWYSQDNTTRYAHHVRAKQQQQSDESCHAGLVQSYESDLMLTGLAR